DRGRGAGHRERLVPAADRPLRRRVPTFGGAGRAGHRRGERLFLRRRSPRRHFEGLRRRGSEPAHPPGAGPGRARRRPRGRSARGLAAGGRAGPQRDRPDAGLRPRLLHALRDPARPRAGVRRLSRTGILLIMTSPTPLRAAATTEAVRGAVRRLSAVQPGAYRVVSCYLKLEPRDKTRGKYLIKMKNRVREVATGLARRGLERNERETIAADL